MYPEKHFNDLESSQRRRDFLEDLIITSSFLTSMLLIGPLLHEAAHIVSLVAISCSYSAEFGFTALRGINAAITPYCTPSRGFLAFFYSIGYITTILMGSALNFSAFSLSGFKSRMAAALGTGTLLSVLTSASVEGDIVNFLKTISVDTSLGFPVALLLVVVVLLTSLKDLKLLLERQE